jgi:hypothetical protein
MLDILVLFFLVRANKKNALARGRKPGGFIALTFALWFGMQITGVVIGTLLGWNIYAINSAAYDIDSLFYLLLLSYGLAGIGALISYLIAKSCKPGDYYPVPAYLPAPPVGVPFAPPAGVPLAPAQPLEESATIDIIRETSMKGDLTSWSFILNGEKVGNLGNGASRITATKQRQNILRAVSEDGEEYMPLMFEIESGGRAEIHFKGDHFVREACTGILPMSAPPMPPAMPYARPYPAQYATPYMPYAPMNVPPYVQPPPYMPPAGAASTSAPEPADGTTCSNCGAPVRLSDQYCNQCGEKQPGAEQY